MATESIHLEVVTPTGVALSEEVGEVTAPSVRGEFGILPGHLPVLAALRTGIVTFVQRGKSTKVAVGPGFVEVTADKALVLTELFKREKDVEVVKVRLRLKAVDEELDRWTGELDDPRRRELIEEEQWLATQLELIGDPPPPQVREDTRFVEEELANVHEELPFHPDHEGAVHDTGDGLGNEPERTRG